MCKINLSLTVFNLIGLTTITGYIYGMINMDNSKLSWFGLTWINLEFILALNVALEIYQIGLFFTLLAIVASITYCGHIIQVNKKILKLMSICRHRLPLRPLILWRNRSMVAYQLFEHNRVTSLLISGNREIFGHLLYLFIMTNIPGNVYMIRRIFFGKHELIDMVLTWAMVFFQLLVCTVVFGLYGVDGNGTFPPKFKWERIVTHRMSPKNVWEHTDMIFLFGTITLFNILYNFLFASRIEKQFCMQFIDERSKQNQPILIDWKGQKLPNDIAVKIYPFRKKTRQLTYGFTTIYLLSLFVAFFQQLYQQKDIIWNINVIFFYSIMVPTYMSYAIYGKINLLIFKNLI